jgi:hypothetical protein
MRQIITKEVKKFSDASKDAEIENLRACIFKLERERNKALVEVENKKGELKRQSQNAHEEFANLFASFQKISELLWHVIAIHEQTQRLYDTKLGNSSIKDHPCLERLLSRFGNPDKAHLIDCVLKAMAEYLGLYTLGEGWEYYYPNPEDVAQIVDLLKKLGYAKSRFIEFDQTQFEDSRSEYAESTGEMSDE